MKVLSIDALHDGEGWSWNSWSTVGSITKKEFESLDTNRKILRWFRENDFLSQHKSQGKCFVEDDQHNIVVGERSNRRPLYAIEYGPAYNGQDDVDEEWPHGRNEMTDPEMER